MEKRKYDSTVARIAGNILSGLVSNPGAVSDWAIVGETSVEQTAVRMARAVIAEVQRAEPPLCKPCHGTGMRDASPHTSMCMYCQGAGIEPTRESRLEDAAFHFMTCSTCRHEGQEACPDGKLFGLFLLNKANPPALPVLGESDER